MEVDGERAGPTPVSRLDRLSMGRHGKRPRLLASVPLLFADEAAAPALVKTAKSPEFVAGVAEEARFSDFVGAHIFQCVASAHGPGLRNAVLYWFDGVGQGTELKLAEVSLDQQLSGSRVRYRFDSAPLDGIAVSETAEHVCVNVPLADGTIYRLCFPHPQTMPQGESFLPHQVSVPIHSSDVQPVAACGSLNTTVLVGANGTVKAHILPSLDAPDVQVREEVLISASVMNRFLGFSFGGTTDKFPPAVCATTVGDQHLVTLHLASDLELTVAHVGLSGTSGQARRAKFDLRGALAADTPGDDVPSPKDRHIVRCASDPADDGLVLFGIFVSFPGRSKLLCYRLSLEKMQIQLVTTKFGLADGIKDFSLTAKTLYAVQQGSDGQTVVLSTPLLRQGKPEPWQLNVCHPSISSELDVPSTKTPRDVYFRYIFGPKRFTPSAVAKALDLFAPQTSDIPTDWEQLQVRVTHAVEKEIWARAGSSELEPEQYRLIEQACWAEFLSGCAQYLQSETAGRKVVVDAFTGIPFLVSQSGLSPFRACGPLETVYLKWNSSMEDSSLLYSAGEPVPSKLQLLNTDRFLGCIKFVGSMLEDTVAPAFAQNVQQAAMARAVALLDGSGALCDAPEDLDGAVQTSSQFVVAVTSRLQAIHNMPEQVDRLLEELCALAQVGVPVPDYPPPTAGAQQEAAGLLAGEAGLSLLASCLAQSAELMLYVARDMAVTLGVALQLRSRAGLSADDCHKIAASFPKLGAALRTAYTLHWAATRPVSSLSGPVSDALIKQQATLGLPQVNAEGLASSSGVTTVADLAVRVWFDQVDLAETLSQIGLPNHATWHSVEEAHNQSPGQRHWALLVDDLIRFLFAKRSSLTRILLETGQIEQVLELGSFAHERSGPVSFLAGRAQLCLGATVKAQAQFAQTLSCFVTKEAAELYELAAVPADDAAPVAAYLAKIMRLVEGTLPARLFSLSEQHKPAQFQRHVAPRAVLAFAKGAINLLSETASESLVSTLWAYVFKHSLVIGDTDGAFSAMINNPDTDTQRDCLQRLVGVLCERGEIQHLCQLPFGVLATDVCDVLLSKARNMDVLAAWMEDGPNFYQILYAYQVYRENYRAAGDIMYHLGLKYQNELAGLDDDRGVQLLEMQANALVSAANALRLVDKQFQWVSVVKKAVSRPKRKRSSGEPAAAAASQDMAGGPAQTEQTTTVISLKAIENAYLLVHARLEMLRVEVEADGVLPPRLGAVMTPADTLTQLVDVGMFDLAVSVALAHDAKDKAVLRLEPVFSKLVEKCLALSVDAAARDTAWLRLNDVDDCQTLDLADAAWALLRQYLERYDSAATNFQYHRYVVARILTKPAGGKASHMPIPPWLLRSYQKNDPQGLLRVYLDQGAIKAAVDLVLTLIHANTSGRKDLGIQAMHGTRHPLCVWLPFTSIDRLRSELSRRVEGLYGITVGGATSEGYRRMLSQLDQNLNLYFDQSEGVSLSMQGM